MARYACARQHLEDGVVTAGYSADRALVQMIREDLVAERIAIDSYLDALRYLGDQDPTTKKKPDGACAAAGEV